MSIQFPTNFQNHASCIGETTSQGSFPNPISAELSRHLQFLTKLLALGYNPLHNMDVLDDDIKSWIRSLKQMQDSKVKLGDITDEDFQNAKKVWEAVIENSKFNKS